MSRFRVLVTDYVFPSIDIERSVLGAIGAEVIAMQAASDEELLDIVGDADALLVCYAPVTGRVIDRAVKCRVIARYGIGVNNVDVPAASARSIIVTNVPDYCLEEVSDHALAMLLDGARRVTFLDRRVRSGRWDTQDAVPAFRLRGRTLGLVGFGQIPRLLSRKAQAFGLQVVAFDPYVDAASMEQHHVTKVEFDRLLAESDYVSVHVPLTAETTGLINEVTLRAMKPTAFLINTSRGPVVDDDALVRALREAWIAGAALDVLSTEPPARDHPLMGLENVILTPHVAFYSEESLRELQTKAAEEVASVLLACEPRYRVNAPRSAVR
jgi:D-3-phosphoglycerate dehydrogenase